MIFGIGVDIIEISRIEEALSRFGDTFIERAFGEGERYTGGKEGAAQHFATRFAAKEAFLKALGTGLRKGMRWREIEVVTDPSGKPEIHLSGRAREIFDERGLKKVHLSLAHEKGYGIAFIVIEG